MKSAKISDFYFQNIKFNNANNNLIAIASKGSDAGYIFTTTMENCYFDSSINEYNQNDCLFIDISTSSINKNEKVNTMEIDQLNLGQCQGNQEPPPTFITSYFTESEKFTYSEHFSKSEKFTHSEHFSKSYSFTSSEHFSKSCSFTSSEHFSKSENFSPSDGTYIPPPQQLPGDQGKDDKDGTPAAMIGGIVGGVAGAAIIAGVAAFFIKKSRMSNEPEVGNLTDTSGASTHNKNPLYNKGEDDPFKEDFDGNNSLNL